jgi:hypothetical protein
MPEPVTAPQVKAADYLAEAIQRLVPPGEPLPPNFLKEQLAAGNYSPKSMGFAVRQLLERVPPVLMPTAPGKYARLPTLVAREQAATAARSTRPLRPNVPEFLATWYRGQMDRRVGVNQYSVAPWPTTIEHAAAIERVEEAINAAPQSLTGPALWDADAGAGECWAGNFRGLYTPDWYYRPGDIVQLNGDWWRARLRSHGGTPGVSGRRWGRLGLVHSLARDAGAVPRYIGNWQDRRGGYAAGDVVSLVADGRLFVSQADGNIDGPMDQAIVSQNWRAVTNGELHCRITEDATTDALAGQYCEWATLENGILKVTENGRRVNLAVQSVPTSLRALFHGRFEGIWRSMIYEPGSVVLRGIRGNILYQRNATPDDAGIPHPTSNATYWRWLGRLPIPCPVRFAGTYDNSPPRTGRAVERATGQFNYRTNYEVGAAVCWSGFEYRATTTNPADRPPGRGWVLHGERTAPERRTTVQPDWTIVNDPHVVVAVPDAPPTESRRTLRGVYRADVNYEAGALVLYAPEGGTTHAYVRTDTNRSRCPLGGVQGHPAHDRGWWNDLGPMVDARHASRAASLNNWVAPPMRGTFSLGSEYRVADVVVHLQRPQAVAYQAIDNISRHHSVIPGTSSNWRRLGIVATLESGRRYQRGELIAQNGAIWMVVAAEFRFRDVAAAIRELPLSCQIVALPGYQRNRGMEEDSLYGRNGLAGSAMEPGTTLVRSTTHPDTNWVYRGEAVRPRDQYEPGDIVRVDEPGQPSRLYVRSHNRDVGLYRTEDEFNFATGRWNPLGLLSDVGGAPGCWRGAWTHGDFYFRGDVVSDGQRDEGDGRPLLFQATRNSEMGTNIICPTDDVQGPTQWTRLPYVLENTVPAGDYIVTNLEAVEREGCLWIGTRPFNQLRNGMSPAAMVDTPFRILAVRYNSQESGHRAMLVSPPQLRSYPESRSWSAYAPNLPLFDRMRYGMIPVAVYDLIQRLPDGVHYAVRRRQASAEANPVWDMTRLDEGGDRVTVEVPDPTGEISRGVADGTITHLSLPFSTELDEALTEQDDRGPVVPDSIGLEPVAEWWPDSVPPELRTRMNQFRLGRYRARGAEAAFVAMPANRDLTEEQFVRACRTPLNCRLDTDILNAIEVEPVLETGGNRVGGTLVPPELVPALMSREPVIYGEPQSVNLPRQTQAAATANAIRELAWTGGDAFRSLQSGLQDFGLAAQRAIADVLPRYTHRNTSDRDAIYHAFLHRAFQCGLVAEVRVEERQQMRNTRSDEYGAITQYPVVTGSTRHVTASTHSGAFIAVNERIPEAMTEVIDASAVYRASFGRWGNFRYDRVDADQYAFNVLFGEGRQNLEDGQYVVNLLDDVTSTVAVAGSSAQPGVRAMESALTCWRGFSAGQRCAILAVMQLMRSACQDGPDPMRPAMPLPQAVRFGASTANSLRSPGGRVGVAGDRVYWHLENVAWMYDSDWDGTNDAPSLGWIPRLFWLLATTDASQSVQGATVRLPLYRRLEIGPATPDGARVNLLGLPFELYDRFQECTTSRCIIE